MNPILHSAITSVPAPGTIVSDDSVFADRYQPMPLKNNGLEAPESAEQTP
jgi:hypothetical protein